MFVGRHSIYLVVYGAKIRIMVGKTTFYYPRKNRLRAAVCNDVIYDS